MHFASCQIPRTGILNTYLITHSLNILFNNNLYIVNFFLEMNRTYAFLFLQSTVKHDYSDH